MVKTINKNINTLCLISIPYDAKQYPTLIQDMLDTAYAHADNCIGLAAIQIGVPQRVILVKQGDKFIPYINPKIIMKGQKTITHKEGCLSVDGQHEVTRSLSVKVAYDDRKGNRVMKQFEGLTAIIFQHECDHLDGKLI